MNKMSICALNDIEDPNYYVSGPCEFLHLFEKAQLICTDSFHAVAFSMIFRKPFIVFPRNNAKLNMSDKLLDLITIGESLVEFSTNQKLFLDFLIDLISKYVHMFLKIHYYLLFLQK